eukprot:g45425.t1
MWEGSELKPCSHEKHFSQAHQFKWENMFRTSAARNPSADIVAKASEPLLTFLGRLREPASDWAAAYTSGGDVGVVGPSGEIWHLRISDFNTWVKPSAGSAKAVAEGGTIDELGIAAKDVTLMLV